MPKQWKIEELDPSKPRLVIGEGREDVLALRRLLRELSRNDVMVGQVGGNKDRFTDNLKAIGTLPRFVDIVKSIAVVIDADDDPEQAFAETCKALQAASLAQPELEVVPPDVPGTFAAGEPKVGVFLWPRPREVGCLETVCLESVAEDRRVPCIDKFMRCAEEAGAPVRKTGSQRLKARAHAFMATTPDPRAAVGAGFDRSKNIWDLGSPVWEPIKDFLAQL